MNYTKLHYNLRYSIILLILIGSLSLISIHNNDVYGVNVPKQPQDLMDVSDIILVGNINTVNVTEIVETIGTRNPQNYTANIDEYTVKVEEFLKNPLDLKILTVKSQGSRIGGFEKDDRVLFYIKSVNDTYVYFPESFRIPQYCNSGNILEAPRIEGGNRYVTMQDSMEKENKFIANKPIVSIYEKDMGTLLGKNLDILIHIAKKNNTDDKNSEITVFNKEINVSSEKCKWIASAEWEFVLEEGEYRKFVSVKENGSDYITYENSFSVISDTINNYISPLNQFKSGVPSKEIQCKIGLELIFKSSNGFPACVKPDTQEKLIERGWAKPT
jgi:hypothetical protein